MDSEGGECMRSMTDRFDYLKIAPAGRYAIERELGEGGMATVYLAEDKRVAFRPTGGHAMSFGRAASRIFPATVLCLALAGRIRPSTTCAHWKFRPRAGPRTTPSTSV